MVDAVLDHEVDNSLVLIMLGASFLGPAALDELLNTLVDQNLGELVAGSADVELLSRLQGILECLIVVIEVEVELGQQVGHEGTVGEGGVFVQGLAA